MKKILREFFELLKRPFLLVLLFAAGSRPAEASQWITAVISVTNAIGTTNGSTFTINGQTRTGTNVQTALTWLTNSTAAGTATNVWNQIASQPLPAGPTLNAMTNATNVVIEGSDLTASLGGNWATLNLYTNSGTITNGTGVMIPFDTYATAVRTNQASELVYGLSTYSTNAFSSNALALREYVSRGTNVQTVLGPKTFNQLNGGTNTGVLVGGVYQSPILTNASSPGEGTLSTELGELAQASGAYSTAFGYGAKATNYGTIGIGYGAIAYGSNGLALGVNSIASGENDTALGQFAEASGTNSMAIGFGSLSPGYYATAFGYLAEADHDFSMAIGPNAITTQTNEVIIGSPTTVVNVPGTNTIARAIVTEARIQSGTISNTAQVNCWSTNQTFAGSNNATGGWAWPMATVATMANGNNRLDASNYTFISLSGPTTAWDLNGIIGGWSGRLLALLNASGYTMTLVNESGWETTAGQRISCVGGVDVDFLPGSVAQLFYTGTRWVVAVGTPATNAATTDISGLVTWATTNNFVATNTSLFYGFAVGTNGRKSTYGCPGNNSWLAVGEQLATSGTLTSQKPTADWQAWINFASATSSNSTAGIVNNTLFPYWPGRNTFYKTRMGFTGTNWARHWIALTSTNLSTMGAVDTPTGANIAGFRFSMKIPSTANSDTNWMAVTGDTTGFTWTDTHVAYDTNFHTFSILDDSANNSRWLFFVDGACVATNTGNLPSTTIAPPLQCILNTTTLTNYASSLKLVETGSEQDRK